MVSAIIMKWALMVMIVGPGGGSITKIDEFSNEDSCKLALSNIYTWTTEVTDNLRSSHANVGYSLNIKCIQIPEKGSK